MTLPLFDTHAHLNSEDFATTVDDVVQRARVAGVLGINVIGVDGATSRRACELADSHPGYLFASVGIQPNYVATVKDDDWNTVLDLVSHRRVCAVGETGLDCYWNDAPLELQREYFDRHIQLALDHELPIVIHMRESGKEIVEQLQRYSRLPPGIMHSFTGDWELAHQCLDLGLYISFAGMVTFKKSDDLRSVANRVPLDRLLIETDSPYLSPEPFRGKRPNEPERVQHTLRCLAKARALDPTELARITTANAARVLRLSAPEAPLAG